MNSKQEEFACISIQSKMEYISFSGLKVKSIQSAETFMRNVEKDTPVVASKISISRLCQDKWIDLLASISVLPHQSELFFIIKNQSKKGYEKNRINIYFLSIGRNSNERKSQNDSRRLTRNLWKLIPTILNHIQFEPVSDKEELLELENLIHSKHTIEIKRKFQTVELTEGILHKKIGFLEPKHIPKNFSAEGKDINITHLFPWIPSDSAWQEIMELLHNESDQITYLVHFQGLKQVPVKIREVLKKNIAKLEKLFHGQKPAEVETVLYKQISLMIDETIQRISILFNNAIAARAFIMSKKPIPNHVIGTIKNAIDDTAVEPEYKDYKFLFKSGIDLAKTSSTDILHDFKSPNYINIFGIKEATSILRTPNPASDIPGISINRARTSAFYGISGDDYPLGINEHHGERISINLDESMRSRHTYIIGQTGTGKSTLLLNMINQDITRDRGVCVIDPHGTLIEEILKSYPERRKKDLIILDPTDHDYPVGFNNFIIEEEDPYYYQLARDLIIDDLYSLIDKMYDLKQTGGPMFESQFRGMLSILLGNKPPKYNLIPSLLLFKKLYSDRNFLKYMASEIRIGNDFFLQNLYNEIINTTGEANIHNMAPYVTSKLTRFVSDLCLRNILCQNRTIDFEEIVNTNKVFLVFLGKGRFGDNAAALLASQIITKLRHVIMKRDSHKRYDPYYLYADEFHLFANFRFPELLAEARKYNFCMTLAHQYTDQLKPDVLNAVLGNVGTLITFRVGAKDVKMIEPLYRPIFSDIDILSLQNFKAYVRSFGKLGVLPFSVNTLPPPQDGKYERIRKYKDHSRKKYGRERKIVEEEVSFTYNLFVKYAAMYDKLRNSESLDTFRKLLGTHINDLEISEQIKKSLIRAHLSNVSDLISKTEEEMLDILDNRKIRLRTVIDYLDEYGLTLGMDVSIVKELLKKGKKIKK